MCSSEIIFLDHDTGENIIKRDSDLDIVERNITFTTEQLKANRHYIVTIQAWNTNGSFTSYTNLSEDFMLFMLYIMLTL